MIVDSSTHEAGVVTTGVVVELRYEGDDDTERFLVGSIEEKVEGVPVISPASPLGQALIGKSQGDRWSTRPRTGACGSSIVSVGS